MKKKEAEAAIPRLASEWAGETGYVTKPGNYTSFTDFDAGLERKRYGHYVNFRSQVDPANLAEGWCEAELRTWLAARQS